MSRRRKKQLTYVVIAVLFLLTGIEYAVILPTLYLYLQSFGASAQYLGLTLSAFSFSGLFSSPIIGSISDRTRSTKYVLLFANLWEIGGNILYFAGISPFYILLSRLIAGVGAGVGAAVTADIARSTSVDERTSVLSLVMLCRQFGLILGPSFNLFLVLCNFSIGPFRVTSLSAPGIFMALLWILLEVMVVFCYYDLATLADDECTEKEINYSVASARCASGASGASGDADSSATNNSWSPDGAVSTTPSTNSVYYKSVTADDTDVEQRFSASYSGQCNKTSADVRHLSFEDTDKFLCRQTLRSVENVSCRVAERHVPKLRVPSGTDNHMIESAERFMGTCDVIVDDDGGGDVAANTKTCDVTSCVTSRNGMTSAGYAGVRDYGSIVNNAEADVKVIRRNDGANYYVNEYCREEIVVILYSAFAAMVNQTGLEAMLTPLTQKYLHWGEMENSYLFLGAGIQIIIVFIVVHFVSKRFSDVTLLTFGYVLICISTSYLLADLPTAPTGSRYNMAPFLFAVMTNVAGLPFVFVCTISLFSKVTREETQGFSQGLRRTCMGLGAILGPLWTGGMIEELYIMLGVLLGLIGLALILTLLSFCHLRRLDNRHPITSEGHTAPPTNRRSPLIT